MSINHPSNDPRDLFRAMGWATMYFSSLLSYNMKDRNKSGNKSGNKFFHNC